MSESSKKLEAQQREMPEPWEGNRPVPWLVLGIIAGLFLWAVGYIWITHQDAPPSFGDRRSLADFEHASAGDDTDIDAGKLYAANCVACHQAEGQGVPGAFPPLGDSEWVVGEPAVLVQILLHGVHGELTVGDDVYDGDMPPFGDKFSDGEMAALATHLRTSFGNDASAVEADLIEEQREAHADRDLPWNGDEDLNALLNELK